MQLLLVQWLFRYQIREKTLGSGPFASLFIGLCLSERMIIESDMIEVTGHTSILGWTLDQREDFSGNSAKF